MKPTKAATSNAERATFPLDDPRHGTPHAYTNLVCRCDPCRAAWAAYVRQRRAHYAGRRGV